MNNLFVCYFDPVLGPILEFSLFPHNYTNIEYRALPASKKRLRIEIELKILNKICFKVNNIYFFGFSHKETVLLFNFFKRKDYIKRKEMLDLDAC